MKMEEDLKKMDIYSIETLVEDCSHKSRDAQREMIECLLYLRTSGRFKENKRYARASFFTYIDDRFNIREGTYREMELAYVKFPKETVEYGVGLVSKVIRLCGRSKAKNVIGKIETAKAACKTEIKRDRIEKIINENRTTPFTPKVVIDWKGKYEAEAEAHDKTKILLREALDTINELRSQVEKLKLTIQKERGEISKTEILQGAQVLHA